MDQMNKLICLLMAIHGKAKDIHYTCHGEDFYGKHLFADRVADGINEFIDQIKETCILGHGQQPLNTNAYFVEASKYLNGLSNSYENLLNLIVDCLEHIEKITNISKGDSNVLDTIAGKLQNDKGLLHIMFGR